MLIILYFSLTSGEIFVKMDRERKPTERGIHMNINAYIKALVNYGCEKQLIGADDRIYATNRILNVLKLDSFEDCEAISDVSLEEILKALLDDAVSRGVCEDSVVYRDLLDTEIMNCIVPRPSEVIRKFREDYAMYGPRAASDNFYAFSCDTDYIRRYRIAKDMRWKTHTEYGDMDITINLSKPEKDPKAIAAARNASSGYPKCQLCIENVGYAGRVNHPARATHRVIPMEICGGEWAFQYSPYVYYNEHCIVFNQQHTPMVIDKSAFEKLFSFIGILPHYFVGSNADLPIVGGSILAHEHFQGGNYEFAMAKAPVEKEYVIKGFEDVKVGRVKWPMSVIRISCADPARLCELGDIILRKWRGYTDESAFIYAFTDNTPHNTITPIARKRGEMYELDLVLRNNITTEEHPLGVYHPHAELHHIKKENIGLIEVMGLAVLPSRLKGELEQLASYICEGRDYRSDEVLAKHAAWADTFAPDLSGASFDEVLERIKEETGKVFAKVLEHAGVYKRNEEGYAAFDRFIESL